LKTKKEDQIKTEYFKINIEKYFLQKVAKNVYTLKNTILDEDNLIEYEESPNYLLIYPLISIFDFLFLSIFKTDKQKKGFSIKFSVKQNLFDRNIIENKSEIKAEKFIQLSSEECSRNLERKDEI
jgi:hypothetical protein